MSEPIRVVSFNVKRLAAHEHGRAARIGSFVADLGLSLALGVRPPARAQRTFPSRAPRWALDWVLASPDLTIGDVRVVPTALSDHAAIVADVARAA